jgi:hypothetical protein
MPTQAPASFASAAASNNMNDNASQRTGAGNGDWYVLRSPWETSDIR